MADGSHARPRRSRAQARTVATLLDYLAAIERAVAARDDMGVTRLLRKRTATHLPREVRDELLMIARAPRESLRAPVRFLRFVHRMRQLAVGSEPLPGPQIELDLEAPAREGAIRRRAALERRAACDPDGADPASRPGDPSP